MLDVDYQRAPRPRKFQLHRIRNFTRSDDLGGAGDEIALARTPSSLHLPGSDQQLHAVVLAEILLGLTIAASRKNNRILADAQGAHVIAPIADHMGTVVSGCDDRYELGCLTHIAAAPLDFRHSDSPRKVDDGRRYGSLALPRTGPDDDSHMDSCPYDVSHPISFAQYQERHRATPQ